MGVIANNPHHLAGAIDSDGADKGTRFIQLCDAFDIPVLSLMDCPGNHGGTGRGTYRAGAPQRADVQRAAPT